MQEIRRLLQKLLENSGEIANNSLLLQKTNFHLLFRRKYGIISSVVILFDEAKGVSHELFFDEQAGVARRAGKTE